MAAGQVIRSRRRIAGWLRVHRQYFQLITDFAVVISVGIMVWLYFAERQDAQALYKAQRQDQIVTMRRTTAVEMIGMRYNDRVVAAHQGLSAYLFKNRKMIFDLASRAPDDRVLDFTIPDQTNFDIVMLVDFFTDVLQCRDSEQCDEALIDGAFKKDICALNANLEIFAYPKLRSDNSYGPQFAEKLSKFSQKNCKNVLQ